MLCCFAAQGFAKANKAATSIGCCSYCCCACSPGQLPQKRCLEQPSAHPPVHIKSTKFNNDQEVPSCSADVSNSDSLSDSAVDLAAKTLPSTIRIIGSDSDDDDGDSGMAAAEATQQADAALALINRL